MPFKSIGQPYNRVNLCKPSRKGATLSVSSLSRDSKCISLNLDKFLPLKNKNFFVFFSLNRNFALPLTSSKVLAFDNENKKSSIFILHCTHLIVPLRQAVKVGCISAIKINANLFCISLDLHYLCPDEM